MKNKLPITLIASMSGTLILHWDKPGDMNGESISLDQACTVARDFCDKACSVSSFKTVQLLQNEDGDFCLAPKTERLDENRLLMNGCEYRCQKAELPDHYPPFEFVTSDPLTGKPFVEDRGARIAALSHFVANEVLYANALVIRGAPELALAKKFELINAIAEKTDTSVLVATLIDGSDGLINETPRELIRRGRALGIVMADYGIDDSFYNEPDEVPEAKALRA